MASEPARIDVNTRKTSSRRRYTEGMFNCLRNWINPREPLRAGYPETLRTHEPRLLEIKAFVGANSFTDDLPAPYWYFCQKPEICLGIRMPDHAVGAACVLQNKRQRARLPSTLPLAQAEFIAAGEFLVIRCVPSTESARDTPIVVTKVNNSPKVHFIVNILAWHADKARPPQDNTVLLTISKKNY